MSSNKKNGCSLGCRFFTCAQHADMAVMHVRNQWIEEDHAHRQACTVPPNLTTSRNDCHIDLMVVKNHTDSSTLLSTTTDVELFVSTFVTLFGVLDY